MRTQLVDGKQVEQKRRPNWPFLFYQEKGKMYFNPGLPPESKYKCAKKAVGEAPI